MSATARIILGIIAALAVGLIGYQIGVSQNLASQIPAASGAPAYYGMHWFGFGFPFFFPFFGFLFPLLFFFLIFGLIRAAVGGGRGWGYGAYERRRARLEELHRELHGEKPTTADRPPEQH